MKVKYVTGVSNKTGKTWHAVDVEIVPGYLKRVFLTEAEALLIAMRMGGDNE